MTSINKKELGFTLLVSTLIVTTSCKHSVIQPPEPTTPPTISQTAICDSQEPTTTLTVNGTCLDLNDQTLLVKCYGNLTEQGDPEYHNTTAMCENDTWTASISYQRSLFYGFDVFCSVEDSEFGLTSPVLKYNCE